MSNLDVQTMCKNMYGIEANGFWLTPKIGPVFFGWSKQPVFPFRTEAGAKALASDFATGKTGSTWDELLAKGWQCVKSSRD